MPVERDFIAHLGLVFIDPGIPRMGHHLTLEICPYILRQRHVLGVPEAAIRLRLALQLAALAEHDLALLVAEGTLHRDGAIAEFFILEDARERRELHRAAARRDWRLF